MKTWRKSGLGAFLAALQISGAAAAQDVPPPVAMDAPLSADLLSADLEQRACGPAHAVVFADTDHEDTSITDFVGSDLFMNTLKGCGFDTFYVELRQKSQDTLDDFASGAISPDQFKAAFSKQTAWDEARLNSFLKIAVQAREAGVHLVAYDRNDEGCNQLVAAMYMDMRNKAYVEAMPEDHRQDMRDILDGKDIPQEKMDALDAIIKSLPENDPYMAAAAKFQALFDDNIALCKQRVADDSLMSAFIGAHGGGKRVAVMVGAAHTSTDNPQSLVSLLGAEGGTQVIVLEGKNPVAENKGNVTYDVVKGTVKSDLSPR